MSDLIAVAASVAGALSLTWSVHEVRAYLARRRRHGAPRAPGFVRLRVALYAGLVTVGALLGMAIGAWLER